ncbi:MAG: DUF3800 domain-containing protein [Chitinivibrionales bacterium]|nr:DUF3800 domain-containing protein [Chitinivibrionales bacterium]
MILVYIDESGDTGHNLSDKQQPVFVLGGLIVPQSKWKELERQFHQIIVQFFGGDSLNEFELHTMDLVNRRGFFKPLSLEQTKAFRDKCLELVQMLDIKIVYRSIEKKEFQKFCEKTYGKGISIAPYIMALPFVCTRINEIIKAEKDLGILIFDEHHNLLEIEKSLRTLRLDTSSTIQADNLIEQGFFVDSSKSEALQLVDLVLYYVRKYEETKLGYKVSPHHKEVFPVIEKISESLREHDRGWDILDWVKTQALGQKKSDRPRRKEPSRDDPQATAD